MAYKLNDLFADGVLGLTIMGRETGAIAESISDVDKDYVRIAFLIPATELNAAMRPPTIADELWGDFVEGEQVSLVQQNGMPQSGRATILALAPTSTDVRPGRTTDVGFLVRIDEGPVIDYMTGGSKHLAKKGDELVVPRHWAQKVTQRPPSSAGGQRGAFKAPR